MRVFRVKILPIRPCYSGTIMYIIRDMHYLYEYHTSTFNAPSIGAGCSVVEFSTLQVCPFSFLEKLKGGGALMQMAWTIAVCVCSTIKV